MKKLSGFGPIDLLAKQLVARTGVQHHDAGCITRSKPSSIIEFSERHGWVDDGVRKVDAKRARKYRKRREGFVTV